MKNIIIKEEFYNKFSSLYKINKVSIIRLLQEMEYMSFVKGDYIVREGEYNDNLYIITDGVVRGFRYNNGEEYSLWFSTDATMFCQVWGYSISAKSQITIEAEDITHVFYISKAKINELCNLSLEFANIIRILFENHARIIEDELTFFADNSDAKGRYLAILKREPLLLQKIPLKKLASYLLITPQSLSRIRKGMV